jgi:N-acetyl-anhydromuramyl-L-alanine amidase AmpD
MATRYPGSSAFVQARNFTRAAGANLPVSRIVIHDMEMAEKGTTAESCAALFASSNAPQASAHFCVDSDTVVQCVDIDRIAWHAPPNTGSIGIEHAGFANQNLTSWLDDYGKAMLNRSAALCAWLCLLLDVPARWLTPAQLRAGERGLCTHASVSAAWHQTDHSDPGPDFPKLYYLDLVRAHLNPTQEDDMPTPEEIATAVWNHPAPNGEKGSDGKPLTMGYVLLRDYQAGGRVEAAVNEVETALDRPTT